MSRPSPRYTIGLVLLGLGLGLGAGQGLSAQQVKPPGDRSDQPRPYPDPWSAGKSRPRNGVSYGPSGGSEPDPRDRIGTDGPRLKSTVRLAEIQELLFMAKWRKARQASDKFLSKMTSGEGGRPLPDDLATALMYRSVAEVGLQLEEDARWSWHLAQAFNRGARHHDFIFYAVDDGFFAHNLLRKRGAPVEGAVDPAVDDAVRPPVQLAPHPALQLSQGAPGEAVEVEFVVDTQGRVRQPVFVTWGEDLAWAYSLVERLRELRFQPAVADGKPVAVLHQAQLTRRHASTGTVER